VNSIPNSAGFTLPGGKIGVLVIHGFTGSPVSIAPWAKFLNKSGYTVSAPLLPGHGSSWQQMNQTSWQDWYDEVEKSFLELITLSALNHKTLLFCPDNILTSPNKMTNR